MRIYPENLFEKCGFDEVKKRLSSYCLTDNAKEMALKLSVFSDAEVIRSNMVQITEMLEARKEEKFPSTLAIYSLSEILNFLKKTGYFIAAEEFVKLSKTLNTALALQRFFTKESENSYNSLKGLAASFKFNTNIPRWIETVLDDDANVKDNASPELQKIRKQFKEQQSRLRKSMETLRKSLLDQDIIKDSTQYSIRNGRMVIPLPSSHKRHLQGIVQDVSASGQTVYVEPQGIMEGNNALAELAFNESQEIQKILIALADKIRPHRVDLKGIERFIKIIDFIMAKAKLANEIGARQPKINEHPHLKLRNARNPLLEKKLKEMEREIVPLNIDMQPEQRIIIISGPNAGGKSVSLKTTLLLQLMAQSGMLIPAENASSVGVFDQFFIDMGDDQSLDDDLSTYSAHLTHMHHFINNANEKTLFCIDELGSGTEPGMGGAIAEALLEKFRLSGAFGIVTTHFSNLKKQAQEKEGLVNASMLFDTEHLSPQYKLEIGIPGSSFALELARKIGFDDKFLEQAAVISGKQTTNLETLLYELEQKKKKIDEQQSELNAEQNNLERIQKDVSQRSEELKFRKKKILNDAKLEAEKMILETRKELKRIIKEAKKSTVSVAGDSNFSERLKKIEQDTLPDKEFVREQEEKKYASKYKILTGKIREGDYVKIAGQDSSGQVLKISGHKAEIAIGDLKTRINIDKLEKIASPSKSSAYSGKSASESVIDKIKDFHYELDIRGMRAEAALSEIQNFMDNAILANAGHVRILHGKGSGILRDLVRRELYKYDSVKEFHDEHADRGGAGITLINLS